MIRLRMSRPFTSVPSKYSMLPVVGPVCATEPARPQRAPGLRPGAATAGPAKLLDWLAAHSGDRHSLCHSPPGAVRPPPPRPSPKLGGGGWGWGPASLRQLHARIEPGVEQVDDEVDQHERGRDDEDGGLHHRE